ncbi:hypothetical protein Bbelb_174560 [Branchiostoma belcheri]|nr:hypothetical protein Bbelb_174560 [Branchiostoma belcheri]
MPPDQGTYRDVPHPSIICMATHKTCTFWVRSQAVSAGAPRSQAAAPSLQVADICSWSEGVKEMEHESFVCLADKCRQLVNQQWVMMCWSGRVTGPTALHWGAKHGNQEIVALMADAGLDVNLRSGYTPLHLAAMYGHDHIVKLLIDAYDADVTIRDYSGRRPGQRLRPGSSTNVDEVVQRKKQRSSSLSSFNPRHSMKDFKELVTTIGSALKMKAPPKHH